MSISFEPTRASGRQPTASGAGHQVAQLFREHGPFVWRTLRRLGLSEADADDLSQEVFVVVFQRLDSFEHRSTFKTWIYGITARVALAHRRRARTKNEQLWASPPELTSGQAPDRDVEEREALQLLDRALAELDDDKRAVFVLFELEQLAMRDVAEALECPLQTAYSRLNAARDQVQSFVRKSSRGRWTE